LTINRIYRAAGSILLGAAVLTVGAVPGRCQAASAQKMFEAPEKAVEAFVDAIRKDDSKELKSVLGPEADEVISSGDETADKTTRAKFLQFFDEKNQVLKEGEDKAELIIGNDEWPFPIPIVKGKTGWFFDTASGKEEILDRRIGRNELQTVQVLLAAVDAQREYAMEDRDNDGILEYAEKFRSDPDAKNGLFWKVAEGEKPSPLGLLAAQAQEEHYAPKAPEEGPQPFHGYLFRMIKKQGPNAPGGALDYVVNGSMIGGFAIEAYPVEYGNSGVMTFMVNYDGVVYQKDLGPDTDMLAKEMDAYNPDASWEKAKATIE
jgi:hypothetical protein